jgi:ATP-binding cassette subfamily C protein
LAVPEKRYAAVAIVLSVSSSVLDLAGVAIIGLMGSLAISGIQSRNPGNRVSEILNTVGLEQESVQVQMAFLGFTAVLLLIAKTLGMYFGTKSLYLYFSKSSAHRSSQVLRALISSNPERLRTEVSQHNLYVATGGVTNLYLGVIATFISTFADAALALLIIGALLVVTPLLGFTTLLYFAGTGISLYLFLRKKTLKLADQEVRFGIGSNSIILESFRLQPEIVVRDTADHFVGKTFDLRNSLSSTLAMKSLLPNISKYAMEASLTIGMFIIAGIQFLLYDASHAFASIALFIAAGTRIVPSVLRVQQGALTISSSLRMSESSLSFLEKELSNDGTPEAASMVARARNEEVAVLNLSDVFFTYQNQESPVIKGVSFDVKKTESIGVVGLSGSGKTTLINLCLGQLEPDSGNVKILGMNPREVFKLIPGYVAYVPQNVEILDGSVEDNLRLGLGEDIFDENKIWNALRDVGLEEFFRAEPDQLNAQLGERGSRLSGGQKQKIGIARALLTSPELIFLDEATSAMDSESENVITEAIGRLQGNCALIVIAHRLSTLRHLEKIIILEDGVVAGSGSFQELVESNPIFRRMVEAATLTEL